MPLSPIEIVEQIVTAWNQRDWEAAESLCDPEIVADYSRRLVDPGIYHGHHAMRDSRLLLLGPWTDVSIEIEDTIVYGDNVVALMRVGATGKASGANVEARFADLWTIRAGAAVRLEYLGNRDEAIAAASGRLVRRRGSAWRRRDPRRRVTTERRTTPREGSSDDEYRPDEDSVSRHGLHERHGPSGRQVHRAGLGVAERAGHCCILGSCVGSAYTGGQP